MAQAVRDVVIIRWLHSIFNSANTANLVHFVLPSAPDPGNSHRFMQLL